MHVLAWMLCALGDDDLPKHAVGPFDVTLELELGWRAVAVGGSRAEFDEDFDIASGAFLRELEATGERAREQGSLGRFAASISGLGDPSQRASLELGFDALRARSRYTRTDFVGTTENDVHAVETVREQASLELLPERGDSRGTSTSVGLTWTHRDSFSSLSRSVDFGFVAPVPTHRDDRELGLTARTRIELDAGSVELTGRARHSEATDSRDFALPSPSAPSVTQTEDFDAALETDALGGGVHARRRFGKLELDAAFDYDEVDGGGDEHSIESGVLIDPSSPFRRDTNGRLDLRGRRSEAALGARWRVNAASTWFARAVDHREASRDVLDRHVVLDESGSVSTLDLTDVGRVSLATELFELGVERTLGAHATLCVTGRTGRTRAAHFETVQGSTSRDFAETLPRWGGEVELDLEPATRTTLAFELGTGVEPTHNTYEGTSFAYGEDRASWGSVRWRWQSPRHVVWQVTGTSRVGTSEAFDSRSHVDAVSVSCSGSPSRNLHTNVSAGWRHVDLSANTVVLFGFQQFRAVVDYASDQWDLSGGLTWEATPRWRPTFAWSTSIATSDGGCAFSTLGVELPYELARHTTLALELDLRALEADVGQGLADYRASVVALTLRTAL
ncbi:MAG: hypothetical protein IT453_17385, partial [Planctomycetes bacterium]|nr:hypothetical protein [Planctomycetota bacterium]